MIQANELRIGNRVHVMEEITGRYNSGALEKIQVGRSAEVNSISIDGKITVGSNDLLISVSPIILTEEILLEFGFEKHTEEYCLNNLITFYTLQNDYNNIKMVLIKSSHGDSSGTFYSYLHYSPNSTKIETDKDKIPKIHILYLHQLQNLHFALTGKELEEKK